jgi:hypothetical protein
MKSKTKMTDAQQAEFDLLAKHYPCPGNLLTLRDQVALVAFVFGTSSKKMFAEADEFLAAVAKQHYPEKKE